MRTGVGWTSGGGLLVGLALCITVLPGRGEAQHPLPGSGRPLHQRLPLADVVAVVDVEAVAVARIRARPRRVLRGSVPERFEIKRSPAKPPPLEEGDTALLLLRGARSPYVLVDAPHETIRLAGDAMERRWAQAVERFFSAERQPQALAALYLDWIDRGPETLRDAGLAGLLDRRIDTEEFRQALSLDRAAAAVDPSLEAGARRIAALLAGRTETGTAALLPRLGARHETPAVVGVALRAGATHGLPESLAALQRCLGHPDPAVRRAGLDSLPMLASRFGDVPLSGLERMAREDPDPELRRRAGDVLQQIRPKP